MGFENLWDTPFFFEAGGAGVDFFFVLSGFLITTLLLKENEHKGTIDLKKFYLRRVLRIWPLYYFIIVVCYFIIPPTQFFYINGYSEFIYDNFLSKLLYSFFFMPNVALSVYKGIPYAAPLWSVGVEEQFYLFWPLLLLFFKNKLRLIIAFIILFIAVKAGLALSNSIFSLDEKWYIPIKDFLVATRMECMGIGGLGAYLVFKKYRIGNLLKSNYSLLVATLLLPPAIIFAKDLLELHHIVFAALFLIIIINGATNNKTPVKLENKVFLMLGNISYGLYLWHSICLGLLINLLSRNVFLMNNSFWFNTALYWGTFGLSIGISWLSYRYLETPFLKFKKKFAVIISGADARKQASQY